ncbi:hypothetical protein LOC51_22865 [Rubrivivax sp. JA1024]|nr:hypothetical protein [Rubrivivax sp. JA1024]
MLKDYRADLVDRDGHIAAIKTFRAADDAFALLKSKQISLGGGFELWRSGDSVARIDADGQTWDAPAVDGDEAALNGLYKIEVSGGELHITGTFSLLDEVVRGGQATYAITGRYRRIGDAIAGIVLARRHSPQHRGYVYRYDEVRLQLDGWVFVDYIAGSAVAAELDAHFEIRLIRLSS